MQAYTFVLSPQSLVRITQICASFRFIPFHRNVAVFRQSRAGLRSCTCSSEFGDIRTQQGFQRCACSSRFGRFIKNRIGVQSCVLSSSHVDILWPEHVSLIFLTLINPSSSAVSISCFVLGKVAQAFRFVSAHQGFFSASGRCICRSLHIFSASFCPL